MRVGHARVCAAVAGTVLAANAQGAVVHDEGVHGDISGDRLNPTNLGTLGVGEHSVLATSVAGDREYFTFEIPLGLELSGLFVDAYSGQSISFVGVQAGATFTEPATGANVANILGYHHFGGSDVGSDILGAIGSGAGAIGFTPPLGASDYTFWSQETGSTPVSYALRFVVTPAPATGATLLGAMAGWRRRRR